MKNRLRELKDLQNLTSRQMAEDLAVSKHTVDSWLSGNRNPSPSHLLLIEKCYKLNPGWLSGETDEMYAQPEDDRTNKKRQVKELMTCKTEFAINTMVKLSEASEMEWSFLERMMKEDK